jgi:hypothetical protein
MEPHHSTLEVDNRAAAAANAPEVFPYYAPQEVYPKGPAPDHDTSKVAYYDDTTYNAASRQHKTICGLRRRTFWIALIVVLIVVAAAVGGGVGGTRSKSSTNAQSGATPEQSSTTATTPSPTTTTPTATLSTQILTNPTSTASILRDCPSSNSTLLTISSQSFRKICNNAVRNSNGITASVNEVVASLDECIALCAAYNVSNRTQIVAGKSKICNSVCWRNTYDKINDWEGGRCFGYESRNVTGGEAGGSAWNLPSTPETICDSAGLINPQF